MRTRATLAASFACAACLTSACGGGEPAEGPPDAAGSSSASGGTTTDTNQRRLTRAESLELVAWATEFRSCVLRKGTRVGPLTVTKAQLAMKLPPGTADTDVLPVTVACGDAQGGPPQEASLQYRPGHLVLYLPKQCLLDEQVAGA